MHFYHNIISLWEIVSISYYIVPNELIAKIIDIQFFFF